MSAFISVALGQVSPLETFFPSSRRTSQFLLSQSGTNRKERVLALGKKAKHTVVHVCLYIWKGMPDEENQKTVKVTAEGGKISENLLHLSYLQVFFFKTATNIWVLFQLRLACITPVSRWTVLHDLQRAPSLDERLVLSGLGPRESLEEVTHTFLMSLYLLCQDLQNLTFQTVPFRTLRGYLSCLPNDPSQ